MGLASSAAYYDSIHCKELKKLFNIPEDIDDLPDDQIPKNDHLCRYTMFDDNDPDREFLKDKFLILKPFLNTEADRAMGCFICNIVGDALGAPLEFQNLKYNDPVMKNGFSDAHLWLDSSFHLKPGQWTDDASMALCLADALIYLNGFKKDDDLYHLRLRFLAWNHYGYNNAFGYDDKRPYRGSVGLGGNIAMSMQELEVGDSSVGPFTKVGDKNTCGNGSIMRNSPISVFYSKNIEEGMKYASKQSLTTHQGEEAAECCRLLTYICITAFKGDGKKDFLGELLGGGKFESQVNSIRCLASSQQELKGDGTPDPDRNWDWKNPNFQYSPSRSKQQV
eukprot:TRINITY_DN1324_c0_g1_i4.p1 TRINITY_DN1324_c0_g1~~TRINITY_DN1324_c0_g1_i4.p1  ORF type:complete len:336 (+),score=67.82 TRINITY_DN1324_c0_g1_i4:514-1521(+)